MGQPRVQQAAAIPGMAGHSRTRSGVVELAVGLLVFGIYLVVTHGLHPDQALATEHGRQLLAVEGWLHAVPEKPLNYALAAHHTWSVLASWEYATVYVVSTFATAGWLWWRADRHYAWARNCLIIVTVLGIACFALWPAAPPRLLPGFVDVVAGTHNQLSWGSRTISSGADQLAAMPSLHVAWAGWVSLVVWRTRAGWVQQLLATSSLLGTLYVVLATGNHYWLDAVGGLVAVGVAAPLAALATGGRRVEKEEPC